MVCFVVIVFVSGQIVFLSCFIVHCSTPPDFNAQRSSLVLYRLDKTETSYCHLLIHAISSLPLRESQLFFVSNKVFKLSVSFLHSNGYCTNEHAIHCCKYERFCLKE